MTVPPPLFVFVHLPKAGGTAMREALDRTFGRSRVFWHARDGLIERLVAAGPAAFAPYAVVGGHFGGPLVTPERAGRPVMIVGLVREPEARLVSHFAFFKRHPGNHPPVGPDETLIEALQPEAQFARIVHAVQPRLLTGRTDGLRALAELDARPHLVADVSHAQAVLDRVAALAGRRSVRVGRANVGEAGYAAAYDSPAERAAVARAVRQDAVFYRAILERGGITERLPSVSDAAPPPA